MNSQLSSLQCILESGIENKLFSAAQLVVREADSIIVSIAVGKTRYNHCKNDALSRVCPITPTTLFDVASLTKPLATTSLIMKACDDNILSLSQKLISINGISFPPWLLSYTIQDLLSHQTPLPAWIDFHGSLPRAEDHETATHYFEREITRLNPRSDGTTWCYSDLGFILLGFILEIYYQKQLPELFCKKIASPIGLDKLMMFTPLHHIQRQNIPATCSYAHAYIQGHPDDANARALTHCAGHAGLFASAEAIAAFVQHLLGGSFPCQPQTVQQFLSYKSPLTPFALGWDRPTSDDSLSGRKPGENVIGHLGFTGCSVWVDLDTKRSVTLLTNRTHMNSEPKSIGSLRRELHHICWNL